MVLAHVLFFSAVIGFICAHSSFTRIATATGERKDSIDWTPYLVPGLTSPGLQACSSDE